MNIVLGFTPYVAFFVVMRVGTVEVAMWAAFAVAALIFLYERLRGRSAKILEIGSVALFGALAAFTAAADWHWTLTAVRLAVDLGLLGIVLVSIMLDRPFTMQYARERVAREYWQTPLFLAINRRITLVWAAAFAALVLVHAATVVSLVPVWADAVVTILAFVYAVNFTARYPQKARNAAGLDKAA